MTNNKNTVRLFILASIIIFSFITFRLIYYRSFSSQPNLVVFYDLIKDVPVAQQGIINSENNNIRKEKYLLENYLENSSQQRLLQYPGHTLEWTLKIPQYPSSLSISVTCPTLKNAKDITVSFIAQLAEIVDNTPTPWQPLLELRLKSSTTKSKKKIDLTPLAGQLVKVRIFTKVDNNTQNKSLKPYWEKLQIEVLEPKISVIDSKPSPPLNFLVLLLDAAEANHLSCYGYHRKTTPNIDKIAEKSVLFTQARTQAPNTLISLYSLFTGKQPDNAFPGLLDLHPYPEDELLLAERLQLAGYRTYGLSVGNAFFSSTYNNDQGFQYFHRIVEHQPQQIIEKSITVFSDWLANDFGEPFFAYIHFLPPHKPYEPPGPFRGEFFSPYGTEKDRLSALDVVETEADHYPGRWDELYLNRLNAQYDENLKYGDWGVGEFYKILAKNNLLENTVIIILADHGEALGRHNWLTHNGTVYEEMLRVPLIFNFPKKMGINPGKINLPVGLIDFTPTILELAGIKVENKFFEGQSLVPLIKKQPKAEIKFKSRLFIARSVKTHPMHTVIENNMKLVVDWQSGEIALYNLAKDPEESKNIIDQHSWLKQFYLQRLLAFLGIENRGDISGLIQAEKEQTPEIDKKIEEELRAIGYF